ncbi:MAG TPA: hypothetical protein VI603_07710 [Saprospiraceae bacterium]|nr:hypothetical protein [Saprospiraceae bacterium]
MKTNKSLRTLSLLVVVICVLFANCDNEGLIPADVNRDLTLRSCQTVTQAWVNELKILAAEEYSVPPSALEVNAIELITASTYEYHLQSELVGTVVNNMAGLLILVTHEGFQGNIIGYYDLSNLSFCASPNESNIVGGEFDEIVYSTLGIIGADSDIF